MKKFISMLLAIIITILVPASSNALPLLFPTNIQYAVKDGQEIISIALSYKTYKLTTLKSPDRIVVDFSDVSISDAKKISINSSLISTIRCGQFEKNTARVVVDIKGQPKYKVEGKKNQFILYLGNYVAPKTDQGGKATNPPSRGERAV